MTATTTAGRARELRTARVPFVHARVVLAERPTSARPGDEAVVLGDGTIEGFVGGTCAQATVREQSRHVLATGRSRLVRVTPDPTTADTGATTEGKVVVHNPCLSGGTLEVFLEPELPTPLALVAGNSPIADALGEVGSAMGWEVAPWEGTVVDGTAAVVVASHGHDEEGALVGALDADVDYVGLVASPRRGREVVRSLGLSTRQADRLDTPAGLDIGARTPHEVAVSILAGIVASRPGAPEHDHDPDAGVEVVADPGSATDPVCGMAVATVASSLHVERDGAATWFCGPGCRDAWLAGARRSGAG